jgi:alpha-galactosidase
MKGLTDYIHSLGLKAGLYSSPGPLTCGRCEGSYGHELQDAESWAEWGFDYVKYDWCTYGDIFKKETEGVSEEERIKAYAKPYRLMNECLKKQKRDILYSFCQYGMGHAELWARESGANCWRSFGDLKDAWHWMELALEGRIGADNYWKYNGPGCWADPDMMIIGGQHSFGSDHPTFLTPNEQYTHVSLWCMIGSPLLIGCDLAALDAFTRNLLVNDEVIAVSQDRLGVAARRIRHTDAESVWTRPLADGSLAVALVNRYPLTREVKVSFEELGLDGGQFIVRDLWRQRCEGKHSGFYAVKVPPHATHLVRVKAKSCSKCD